MTTSSDQIKEDYLVTMGEMLFDENDLNSGENRYTTSFDKLDSNSEAALAIANDLGIIQDLKQKVSTMFFFLCFTHKYQILDHF